MHLYVFDTSQIARPGIHLQQCKHCDLGRAVNSESLDTFTGSQMDHITAKIQTHSTAVRTLTALAAIMINKYVKREKDNEVQDK